MYTIHPSVEKQKEKSHVSENNINDIKVPLTPPITFHFIKNNRVPCILGYVRKTYTYTSTVSRCLGLKKKNSSSMCRMPI